ncbi:MAG: AAA family ATPase [Phycisphaerae bacterium]|nr:AAA family ATPase [Phycisphaerae bacterium]
MSVPVIAFFNNKGGVGKTSLVYHVAWMMADQGIRVVATDLDPQGNLSAAFLEDERLEQLWPENQHPATIYGAVRPLKIGVGDIIDPLLEKIDVENIIDPLLERIDERLVLIPGDMSLSQFEDDLSGVWPKCLDRDERAFRVISAFWRVMQRGAELHRADVVLVDLGPNLGAINRAALISSDSVVIPLGPDIFSLQGLRNLGPTLRAWREGWSDRLSKNPVENLELPKGKMNPVGYIVMQHSVRRDRPVKSYERWIARIPGTYRKHVLGEDESVDDSPSVTDDEHCFALLKHYRSLMPMAQEARKPIFHLKPADGALGAHTYAVQGAYQDFKELALKITESSVPRP